MSAVYILRVGGWDREVTSAAAARYLQTGRNLCAAAFTTHHIWLVCSQAKREEYWHNLRNSMIECSTNHEAFFKKMAHNPDGFGVVVEHFGRSIIV